jgi:hypothetical protein
MAATKVSGPGKFSQRTDQSKVDIPNADYGEQASYQALQQAAPVAAQPGGPPAQQMDFSSLFGSPAGRVVPMGAPTQRPQEPVTTATGVPTNDNQQQDLSGMANQLPVLEFMGNQPNASWGLRNLVRQVKGAL